MKKIDVFTHIWPKPFHNALIDHLGHTTDITRRSEAVPMMTNLDPVSYTHLTLPTTPYV